jgi:phosphoribosylformylglycinamidine (FGAM) synthase PurS component
VLDPRVAIERALGGMGFPASDVARLADRARPGGHRPQSAEAQVSRCERLLANPVIETYRISFAE